MPTYRTPAPRPARPPKYGRIEGPSPKEYFPAIASSPRPMDLSDQARALRHRWLVVAAVIAIGLAALALFGRGPRRELASRPETSTINADVRLFVTTFLAGFIFVSVLIA